MLSLKNHKGILLVLISFSALVILTNVLTQSVIFSGQTEDVALTNAVKKTKEREGVIRTFLTRAENTIDGLRKSDAFNLFLIAPSSKVNFETTALNIARTHQEIMNIRFLDPFGMETVRVSRNKPEDEPEVSLLPQLQNKSHRYYFQKAVNFPANQTWFSKLDLNVEHKQVETPYKATLRAVMPVTHEDEFKGILVINYFMKPLFDALFAVPLYHMILADEDGEILIHYDKNRNWSRYQDLPGLEADIPEVTTALQNETYRGTGYFSRKLELPVDNQLLLVLSLNKKYLAFQEKLFRKNLTYSAITTLIITSVFGFFLASLFKRFSTEYKTKEKNVAELSELNQKINSLLEKNKAYMDMASDGIHIMDHSGNIVTFSHSFSSMLGYSEEEILKLNVRDWDSQLLDGLQLDILNNITTEPLKFETRHKRKDGSFIDVEINAKWISVSGVHYLYASSRDITERKQMETELHKLATTDFLTQLPTRRIFDDRLSEELERFHRDEKQHISVVLLDVDHFKTINDTHGHSVGDNALKHIANTVSHGVRKIDLVSRFGGDEFGLILVGASEEAAFSYLDRIRSNIEKSPLVLESEIVPLSVSFGVTEVQHDDTDTLTILNRADQALYCAKKHGRNRVETFKGMNQC
ncbi:diguanylate cyclase [Vibrio sp. JC009]|uniref:sensor domain-containing diguanylate cyclase n=1 Tax=Vibrio sp. JC009 TaxID=2912314 RepID=UPI0023B14A45|nr:diguanylate cyclase [Vibrio sp. JC009]WED24852.1 diguanylate cyclase [Vibrio sp. JC009]